MRFDAVILDIDEREMDPNDQRCTHEKIPTPAHLFAVTLMI